LHVLANQAATGDLYPSLKVTHLAHNNVGAHGIGQRAEILHAALDANAVNFANAVGLKIISTNSNYAEVFSEGILHWHHVLTYTYSSCFAIYMLQKLWKAYLYASAGGDFSTFNIVNTEKNDPCCYDLLSLDCFSTESLKIYSEGGTKTRFEKTKTVITYPPAETYLNVCIYSTSNCGECFKCIRTLLSLDALNKLDDYHAVFDINRYKSHRGRYYCYLYGEKLLNNLYLADVYVALRSKINIFHRLGGIGWFIASRGFDIFDWFCTNIPFLSKRYNEKVQAYLLRKALAGQNADEKLTNNE